MSNKNEPNVVPIEKDKNYAWCACSESDNQPFCDGSHAKTDMQPAYLCGCKESKNAPYCDGSHLSL